MKGICVGCGEKLQIPPIYILRNMPSVAQDLPTKEMLDSDKTIDLALCQCSKCGMVQLDCESVDYYKNSTRASERGKTLVDLRREDYKYFIETYQLQGKKILEVGAGKGGFLKTLQEMGEYHVKGYGLENNLEYTHYAKENYGVEVFCGDPENPELKVPNAPYDAFMSFSYLARLVHPNEMIQMVSNNLSDDGIGYVMEPNLEHLLTPTGFFDVTRDLISYYSLDTLKFLFQKNNFDIIDSGGRLGYYVYVVVKKRKKIKLDECWIHSENLISQVKEFVKDEINKNRSIAVWCAGHFAMTVLSVAGIGENISYIIDNAEFKKGRYASGSKVLIAGPEHFRENPVDTIMILGPIYIDEIMEEIQEKCSKVNKIVTISMNGIHKVS